MSRNVCLFTSLKPKPPPSIRTVAVAQVYLKGFYEGVMLMGPCAGEKVCDAKAKIRKELMDRGDAMPFFEPESLVMSRCCATTPDWLGTMTGGIVWRSFD